MRTIITEEIDGYTVVLGIDKPVIDAVSTRIRVDESLKADPMILEIVGKCQESAILAKAWNRSRKKRRLAARTQTLDEQYTALQMEIRDLKRQVDEKRFNLAQEDPVYFEPKKGEIIISDEEAEEYAELLKYSRGLAVLLGKHYVSDCRGLSYWHKKDERWENVTVSKLDHVLPDEYYTRETLTGEITSEIRDQMIDDEISQMSPDEKMKACERDREIAAGKAVFMGSTLEIKGDPDHIVKSKKWYESELARIEQRYN